MRKSIVEKVTGKVINVIEWEEGANWSPPEGCILMDGGEIGDTWDGDKFVKSAEIVTEPVRDLAKEIDELKDKTTNLEKAIGIEGAGTEGIAKRLDDMENRLKALEK